MIRNFSAAVQSLLVQGYVALEQSGVDAGSLQVQPYSNQRAYVNPATKRAVFLDEETGIAELSCNIT